MSGSTDRVWERVKATARTLAETRQTMTFHRARALIEEFMREEYIDKPRGEALDFFANELIDHIVEYRASLTAARGEIP